MRRSLAARRRFLLLLLAACIPSAGAMVSCSNDPCSVPTCPTVKPIYSNTFEAAVGAEWSNAERNTAPNGRVFLGRFSGNQASSLTLVGLPSHKALTLTVRLYTIQSWDGNTGPDDFYVLAGGNTLLHTTFSNVTTVQSYPDQYLAGTHAARTGASEVDSLGYVPWGDATYDLAFTFPHSESSIVINFQGYLREGGGWGGVENESWGIDDIYVWAGPGNFPPPHTILLGP